jgi:hypothetical protein
MQMKSIERKKTDLIVKECGSIEVKFKQWVQEVRSNDPEKFLMILEILGLDCWGTYSKKLTDKYGELMFGADLMRNLGYKSQAAFRMARSRGSLPIKVFDIENKRGAHALTKDVARWLDELDSSHRSN